MLEVGPREEGRRSGLRLEVESEPLQEQYLHFADSSCGQKWLAMVVPQAWASAQPGLEQQEESQVAVVVVVDV